MPTVFRGPRQGNEGKTVNIFGGTGGRGGEGGANGGSGGMGEGSRVKIGTTTTVTNFVRNKYSGAPTVRSSFRTIPLGDINLQREIQLYNSSGVTSLRRLHSARVEGKASDVTVAVYQNAGAKQEWRQDIGRYMAIRHPSIVQLYGTASCGDIHAAIFHDDLIPLQQVMHLYKHSQPLTVYIHVYVRIEFYVVNHYFRTALGQYLGDDDCTFFLRRSTGRLCLETSYPVAGSLS
ncbi:hypothetical protein C8R45DRAFT_322445 [Mycena sanguinolenta]|nr:hypothetical protein C8R45DRAFT_322445 [Mycena sanguinolenta]